jgi:hypothetical protein
MACIEAADRRLTEGFHGYDPADNLRWTNGDATLPADMFAGFAKVTTLELHLGCATTYPLFRDGPLSVLREAPLWAAAFGSDGEVGPYSRLHRTGFDTAQRASPTAE